MGGYYSGEAGTAGSGGIAGSAGELGVGGASGVGGLPGSGSAGVTGGTYGGGGFSSGGFIGGGGMAGTGGLTQTGGTAGRGGAVESGGRPVTGGTGGADAGSTSSPPGSGGKGGTDGGTRGSSALGMPCVTNQDCPSGARCCDGSDPSCDGTRLPIGDGTNAGEFVVSADGLSVTDTITGLLWQRDGSGTRVGCITDSSNLTCTWDEAESYCASLVLGGLSGWRLPGWMELFTILDLTTDWTSSPINQTIFPNTPTEAYWTSSLFLGISSSAMFVSFGSATVSPNCIGPNRVRCVRGSRCYPTTRFVVLDGGLVRDALTGLVWQQQGSATTMTWADAQSYCSSLILGGSGFRLPTIKELDSLVDPTLPAGPSIDKTAFPSTGINRYWSGSELPSKSGSLDYAFFGDFSSPTSNTCDVDAGNTTYLDTKLMVRCVR